MTPRAGEAVDRAAAVRTALRALVARKGFHGAAMSAVAAEAGVATGTAYVHYGSKDELVLATYLETKRELGAAAADAVDPRAAPHERFVQLWLALHDHLAADPDRARFLVQVDGSPYARAAHATALAQDGDPLLAQAAAADMAPLLAPLPLELLYDLGFGPAVRLVAGGVALDREQLVIAAQACWRAITCAE